jgi:hypothetical protein
LCHITVTIITIGVWKPREKKTVQPLNSIGPLCCNSREAAQFLCSMMAIPKLEVDV